MKTGNTGVIRHSPPWSEAASMEPGHEDREYCADLIIVAAVCGGLNGARS